MNSPRRGHGILNAAFPGNRIIFCRMHAYLKLPHFKFLALSAVVLLAGTSCSLLGSGDKQPGDCYLDEIQFDQFNRLTFQTISGGQVYRASREFIVDGQVNVRGDYRFNYFEDSLAIQDRTNPFADEPFLSVVFEDEKPVHVVRDFYTSGVTLYHDIEYFEEDSIRIDLERIDSLGDLLYIGYAVYYLNSNGNIVRNIRYRADFNEAANLTKVEDRTYSYDRYPNPQKSLFVPFFGDANFPDVKFFSENNILSYSEDGQTFQYQYEYGENDYITRQTLPSGRSILFSYSNCGNE